MSAMKSITQRLILHPFAFAIFPILALLSTNITEVSPRVALRSLVISLTATLILLIITFIITRNWKKAALTTTLFLLLFYSYGQVYELLQKHPIIGFSLGRHRYLIVIYALLILVGLWLIFIRIKNFNNISQVLNFIGIILLVYPTFQILYYSVHTALSDQRMVNVSPPINSPVVPDNKKLPDVYFLVLDGYTRADALKQDFGYDNSTFLNSLRDMGFYVADCSRTNYVNTHSSLVSTLNMDYKPALRDELAAQGFTTQEDLWLLIKNSKVRGLLESLGYKTISFESGFPWSRFQDADIYMQYTGVPYEMQVMQPFEAMLIRSTALLIWSDTTYKSLPDYKHTIFGATNFPFEFHINQQLYILDQLPHLASFPGPKFVFAHILITHYPFVFDENGNILTDPGFYSKNNNEPIDEEHFIEGYTNGIKFTNSQLTDILHTLITKSDNPPIIVMMGDHGLTEDSRSSNFNAYYLPGDAKKVLYPTITPVNSFRLIFDTIFGTHYGLLPDISYNGLDVPTAEMNPDCIQK
jgi:hypothetical protein